MHPKWPKPPADASRAERRTWRAMRRWGKAADRAAALKERARAAHERWAAESADQNGEHA